MEQWWSKPRNIVVVVDNDSWVLTYALRLVTQINQLGDHARLVRVHEEIADEDVAFYLGCTRITPKRVLDCSKRNLVVHASDLPQGKGFSPLTWQIIDGVNDITMTLFEAAVECDAGDIIFKEQMHFEGHELLDELQHALGEMTITLCMRYLNSEICPVGQPQSGKSTYYARRYPKDSEIDPNLTLLENFNRLRVVDNQKYPAFFSHNGHQYKLTIEKISTDDEINDD